MPGTHCRDATLLLAASAQRLVTWNQVAGSIMFIEFWIRNEKGCKVGTT